MILHKEDFDAIRDLIRDVLREERKAGSVTKPVAAKAEKEKKQ